MGIDGNVVLHIDAETMTDLLGMPAYVGMHINSKGELSEVEYIVQNLSAYQKIDIVYKQVSSEKIILESSNEKYEGFFIDTKGGVFSIDLKDCELPDSIIISTADKTKYNCLYISSIEVNMDNDKKIITSNIE